MRRIPVRQANATVAIQVSASKEVCVAPEIGAWPKVMNPKGQSANRHIVAGTNQRRACRNLRVSSPANTVPASPA
jgi:hypothetical protein